MSTTKNKAAAPPAAPPAPAYWMAPSKVVHRGAEIPLAGHVYVLAPIPLQPFSRFLLRFNEARTAQAADPRDLALNAACMDLAVEGLHLSLKRNYPALTQEQVGEELLDQVNWLETIAAVVANSGAKPQGEPEPGSR